MRVLRCLVVSALAAGVACTGTPAATTFPACTPHSFTSPGKPLPDCSFEGFNGTGVLQLSQLRGKPTVINFWASWCINCIDEMPTFQRVFSSLGGRVTFVGMDVLNLQGETKGAGAAFARRTGVHYTLAYDPHGLLYGHFSATVVRPIMPITVFVGSDGIVKERNFGPFTDKELRAAIKQYFGIT
jgi:cytochrome c biogenesis protein CcmG/thiol:disulfide interchange protein DsbE